MPYSSVSEVPSYVPKNKRKQWMAVWNDSYSRHGDESRAFAEANAAIKKSLISFLMKASNSELYEDPGEEGYDQEDEDHIRGELVLFADYAEDGPTFDPEGKYLCESCEMRSGDSSCTHVVSPISFDSGSCRIYINGDSEEGEPLPQKLTQIEAAYTERPNVKAFGCTRCMYGKEAKAPDEDDRTYWCAFWGCHVAELACCFKNSGDDDVVAPISGSKDKTTSEKAMLHEVTKARDKFEKQIFCPLVKVVEEKREVWGIVTAEVPDRDGEICDYETTVPYYKELADEMSKATDGANLMPLRAMHQSIAAGKGIAIEYRDAKKEIYAGFKVVDDNEWKKVQEGVYTGFSQGGRYVKKWRDGDFLRYTAKPIEASLVDLPCLPTAHFEYVKADGTKEMRKFQKTEVSEGGSPGELNSTPTPVPSANVAPPCTCDCTHCKLGDCVHCDKGSHQTGKVAMAVKYLVTDKDGKGHLPYTKADGKPNHRLMGAAWAALHDGYRGNKYDGPDKQKAIKRLKQIYAQEGIETPAEKSERIKPMIEDMITDAINKRAFGQLGKGMYTVSRFACLTEDLMYLWMALEYEREQEGDESPVTDDLKTLYHELLDHLLAYTEEEVEEAKQHAMV